MNSQIRTLLLFALVSSAFSACSSAAEEMRKHTYPPDFRYLSHAKVSNEMWQLAADSLVINELLSREQTLTPEQRAEIVALLNRMERSSALLQPAHGRSNHPLIDSNIEAFRTNIALARRTAQAEPPNYFLAGSVAGSCLYCHSH